MYLRLAESVAWLVQMRVMLNGSALCGVFIFTVANVMGMNLGDAPDRLSGTNPFENGTLVAYPLFLTVSPRSHFSLTQSSIMSKSFGDVKQCVGAVGVQHFDIKGMKLGDAPGRLSGTNPFKSLSSHMGCLSDHCMVASKDGSAV